MRQTKKIKREFLLSELQRLSRDDSDPKSNHGDADKLLLEYINDDVITKAFGQIKKRYA